MQARDDSKYVPALRFHWLTPYYDIVVRVTTRERAFKKALIQQAMIAPNHRVLDLACGTGTLSLWIKESHSQSEVVGVDGDAAILSLATLKAKQAGLAVQVDKALSFDLPYPDDHFDRVVSSLFFHHLSRENKVRTMLEVHRVLKQGGEFHIADWGKSTSLAMRALFVLIQLLDGFKNTQDNVAGRLIELLQKSGFEEVSVRRTFMTVFGTMALYRAAKGESISSSSR